ncbi:MAG: hypothetical protein DWQ02_21745 [Bacteroidetes bacterium]|nr:MAG: hypothetical protein DWQ02_21745 [Bacteroidota bacterium]
MLRKEKPKRKQHSFKKFSDNIQPKGKRKVLKQKYHHVQVWLKEKEEIEGESLNDFSSLNFDPFDEK